MTSEGIGSAVVVPVGDRVDTDTLSAVADHIPTRPAAIVLDLTAVSFLDSAGLSLLVTEHNRCAEHGVPLRLVADTSVVNRPIELTGLDRLLDIHPTVESAVRAG
ncbi:STAS domain-containing protein [Actinokineospora sp. PR83]|uniref:STAS domain-containing protein n=1 Tax=Actinokineospora sp. PR83 TaxID=2884908 RepID=UPI001F4017E0|nr:STAS domain-containing protein [Actinokineospora sp. PR83]MCG8919265.1 STAS domain-containing protein [Actinokineospora sp. PR83]